MRAPVVPVAFLLVASAVAAAAQDVAPARTGGGCFRGSPAGRCAWFPLIEAGVHVRLTDRQPFDESTMLAYALGVMVNTGPRSALGAEAFGSGEGEARGGVALRARRWLTPTTGLDVVAGVHLAGDASSGDVRPGSPMVQVKLVHRDLVAASARLDVLRIVPNCGGPCPLFPGGPPTAARTSTRLYLGAEVGGHAGVAAWLATGLAVVLIAIAYSSAYS